MMLETVNIYIGYDPEAEPVAFHVCVDSIIRNSSLPVNITPLALNTLKRGYDEKHVDGSNQFIYSRFLIPWLQRWNGWALFLDGDMILRDGVDIAELWALRDHYRSVQVVRHPDYETKHPVKYLGARNENYPKKNWSSVVLWNCASYPNRILRPEFVEKQSGMFLHRFGWLENDRIGGLPSEWNRLVMEQEVQPTDKLLHYTIGTSCFDAYKYSESSDEWYAAFRKAIHVSGQNPSVLFERLKGDQWKSDSGKK